MSGTATVARLALRELWITFRLVVMLAAFVAAGALVALLPAPLPVLLERLAIGLGLAILVVTALAALTMADERRNGRVGWLVTRSVTRGGVLAGWFVALAGVAGAGVGVAGLLGWLAASTVTIQLDAPAFAAAIVAVGATALAAISVALLVGTVVPGRLAGVAAGLLVLGLGVLAWLAPWAEGVAADLVPGAALVALTGSGEGAGSGVAWRSAGAALVAAALALVLARAALERTDL